ncbi:hypothetical protein ACIBF6_12740 [Streptosporangium amethystogenes]|uniref:hypothetical protein n=1 Tax=Streptosporangium amethystogenes TaxID=2002 RepID=UPI0037A515A5
MTADTWTVDRAAEALRAAESARATHHPITEDWLDLGTAVLALPRGIPKIRATARSAVKGRGSCPRASIGQGRPVPAMWGCDQLIA